MDMRVIPIQLEKPAKSPAWFQTPAGEPRGFIQPHALDELWFHTGTACNLACPFCLEGSKPGDNRLQLLRFEDAKPFIDEALTLGVKQFSFTGGEPFVAKDMVKILDYALQYRPCMVLTNATDPLIKRLKQLKPLLRHANKLHFRVSLDHFDASKHDVGRGAGMFALALQGLRALHDMGFSVSVANQMLAECTPVETEQKFSEVFKFAGLPADLHRVEFPDFHPPGLDVATPQVSANCMVSYQTEDSRRAYMCAFSKMVIKDRGKMRVYACTLVDDDPDYALAETLAESMQVPVSMKHHRCYSCFKYGASCSEM
ncbi:radical SAM protein [Methylotenera sp.]|uniref:radical SAM protein n=1 Tax=Methylotenera sp. TaxID=2051956 RepID=UPI0027343642|nr:radical SAM protein [Methylotenera sp.]MDP3004641.1 radical SAM protein [Methylotenera sp.]